MVQPIRKIDLSIVKCWNLILLVMIAHFGGYKAANAQENWSRFRGDRADGVAADDAAKVFNLHLPIVWIQVQTLKDRGDISRCVTSLVGTDQSGTGVYEQFLSTW
jgi:hypothetical protein